MADVLDSYPCRRWSDPCSYNDGFVTETKEEANRVDARRRRANQCQRDRSMTPNPDGTFRRIRGSYEFSKHMLWQMGLSTKSQRVHNLEIEVLKMEDTVGNSHISLGS